MNYETTKQAAARLGIPVRTIQLWVKENKIPGAVRQGRSWMIPADFEPAGRGVTQGGHTDHGGPAHDAMPLMNSAYPVGSCKEFIATIRDWDIRMIAWGEYYYFSGQAELAVQTMEPYRDSDDPVLRYSANLVLLFASFTRGRIPQAMQAFEQMQADFQGDLQQEASPALKAIGAFAVTASSVLLHLPMTVDVDLKQYIPHLPEGMKLWACYMLAHRMYLEKNYHGSLAVAELALSMSAQLYPVAAVYLHLVVVMNLMSLRRVGEARQRIAQAWELALPDDLIEPFGEHHGLLQGMIERFFQKDDPETYERIIAITYRFSAGWRKIHRLVSNREVADNLTTTEFSIAMLYNRGWTAKEIAAYMNLSPRTITNAIQVIYQKLGISGKRELGQFMLA